MTSKTISINRAPVLTLWAAVVAQRLGFAEDEALTLGRAVAGLNAYSKGRRLGLFKPHEEKAKKAREKEPGERFLVEVCGRPVPATNTDDGIRAVKGAQVIQPEGVRRYLAGVNDGRRDAPSSFRRPAPTGFALTSSKRLPIGSPLVPGTTFGPSVATTSDVVLYPLFSTTLLPSARSKATGPTMSCIRPRRFNS